jgi:hypothetical protein
MEDYEQDYEDAGTAVAPYEPPVSERIAVVNRELGELMAEAAQIVAEGAQQESSGQELVPTHGDAHIIATKRSMAAARIRAAEQRRLIEAKREELESLMRQQLDAARAMLGPLQAQVKVMEEGIFTINLYLGNEEQIHRLRDGEPAPADTPITVRQRVLYMDEECAVAAEDGGLDAQSIENFDAWLLADPAHLDQVLPDTKGIVALQVRRFTKDRDEYDRDKAAADQMAYLLIRNGQRLFRTFVNTGFKLGERLVPKADEFQELFVDRSYDFDTGENVETIIEPGTLAWERAMESADRRERYYMRIGMILEGLLHRSTVFQPLPESGVGFLDQEHHDAGRVKLVRDAEMVLGTGAETFRDWQARTNAQLTVGMRIVGAFAKYGGDFAQYRNRDNGRHDRLSPGNASYPEDGRPYVLEEPFSARFHYADDVQTGWVFRYHETEARYLGDSWGYGGEYRLPKRRASCKVTPRDKFILAFDLITVEELDRFMGDRDNRVEYLDLFPLFKSVRAAKLREQEAEAPFRDMLAGVLARENGVAVEEARMDLDELISWFKFKTKHHRPLLVEAAVPEFVEPEPPKDAFGRRGRRELSEHEEVVRQLRELHEREMRESVEHAAKAVRMITAEHKRLLKDRRRPINTKLVRELRETYTDALAIVRPRDGGYLVVRRISDPWVCLAEHRANGEFVAKQEYQVVGKQRQRWTFAWTHPDWEEWDLDADPRKHMKPMEREELRQRAIGGVPEGKQLMAVLQGDLECTAYYLAEGWSVRGDGRDKNPQLVDGPTVATVTARFVRGMDGEPTYTVRRRGNVWRGLRQDKWAWERDGAEVFPEGVAAWERERELAQQERELRRAVWDRIDRAVRALCKQWMERADRERYEEFLAEYQDPGLWEGHRKMLPEVKLSGDAERLAWRIIADAVDLGVDVEGKMLAEVAGAVSGLDPTRATVPPRELALLVIPKGGTVALADEDE